MTPDQLMIAAMIVFMWGDVMVGFAVMGGVGKKNAFALEAIGISGFGLIVCAMVLMLMAATWHLLRN